MYTGRGKVRKVVHTPTAHGAEGWRRPRRRSTDGPSELLAARRRSCRRALDAVGRRSATRELAEELVVGDRADVRRGPRRGSSRSLLGRRGGASGLPPRSPRIRWSRALLLIHDLHPVAARDAGAGGARRGAARTWSPTAATSSCCRSRTASRASRLRGSCSDCAASAVTLELAIKQALEEAAPDLAGLEVEGVAPQPTGRRGLPMATRSGAGSGLELPVVMSPAPPAARRRGSRSSRGRLAGGRSRRAVAGVSCWSRTSTARCSPIATCARAAAGRCDDGELSGGTLDLPGVRRGRSSCRAPAARWTTSACSSSRCRCCASRPREGGAGPMSATDGRRRPAGPPRRSRAWRRAAQRGWSSGLRGLRAPGRALPAGAGRRAPTASPRTRPTSAATLRGAIDPRRTTATCCTSPSGASCASARRCWALRSGDAEYRPTGDAHRCGCESFELPGRAVGERSRSRSGSRSSWQSSVAGCVVALYPSPAGATESELHFAAWSRMVELNPVLAELEPDVEGLIVNRLSDPPATRSRRSTAATRSTGRSRRSWEGISGGRASSGAVAGFFERAAGRGGAPRERRAVRSRCSQAARARRADGRPGARVRGPRRARRCATRQRRCWSLRPAGRPSRAGARCT